MLLSIINVESVLLLETLVLKLSYHFFSSHFSTEIMKLFYEINSVKQYTNGKVHVLKFILGQRNKNVII